VFFDKFKLLCDGRGISPKKAVIEIGLSNSLATKWKKTGATPSGDTLSKIAKYFNISVDSLLPDAVECKKCEFLYSPKYVPDVKAHAERHQRWEKAKKKFGMWNKSQRDKRYEYEQYEKNDSNPFDKRMEAAKNRIFAYFSRSIVGSDFNLSHISFNEYIPYFLFSQKRAFAPDIYKELIKEYGAKSGMKGTYWQCNPIEKKQEGKIIKLSDKVEEPDITFNDFTYALHNETKELTEENKQKLLEMARFFKEQQDKEKNK
jgi:transcriptional regulator with XRE-family HTH domain